MFDKDILGWQLYRGETVSNVSTTEQGSAVQVDCLLGMRESCY